MRITSILVVFLYVIMGSCNEVGKKNMLPALVESDSATVMYYHTPGNPRFYNMIKVKYKSPLPIVTGDVNKRIIKAKDSCITQGKIYFYGKAGSVETIYFSRNKDCMTLSFIKTGEKYFTRMSKKAKELLDSLEKNVTLLPGRSE